MPDHPLTREEALKLAQDLVDYRASSMVSGGRELAFYVLRLEQEEANRQKITDPKSET